MTADPFTPSRRSPQHGSANPYATYVDLEAPPPPLVHAPPPPPPPAAYHPPPVQLRRSSGVGRVLAVIALLLVGGGVATVYGISAYGRSKICGQLAVATGPNAPQPPNTANLEVPDSFAYSIGVTADGMHRYTWMLVFHGTLQDAVNGIDDDVHRTMELQQPGATSAGSQDQTAQLVLVVGNLDAHLKAAQQACGQPVTGILKN